MAIMLTPIGCRIDQGVSHFKLKITPGRIDHVAEIRKAHPNAVLGIDANGSFDASTVSELGLLANLDVAYVEQPVVDMTSEAAATARSLVGAPLFADESVRSVADADNLLVHAHIDGVVVKPGRLGWSGALVVREMANAAGKLWRASGLLETGIGRAYTNTLAACPDAFVSDVAPAEWFLEADITVPSEAGVRVDPDPELLDRYLVTQIDLDQVDTD